MVALLWPPSHTQKKKRERKRLVGITKTYCIVLNKSWKYIFTNPSARARCDTRSFFAEFNGFQFRVFTSPRPVGIPGLQSPFFPGERICGFIIFSRVLTLWKYKRPHPRFEFGSPCPFPTTISITLQAPPWSNNIHNSCCIGTYLPSCKPSKSNEKDMQSNDKVRTSDVLL